MSIVMKLYKLFIITLSTLMVFHSFLSPSIAQELSGRELLRGSYYSLDYDTEDEREIATLCVYSPGYTAIVDNHDPQLSNGKVTPEYGSSSTQFYYSVDYLDADGDTPATISVYIDDEPSSMTLDSGGASNGTYKSEAKTLGLETHTYYFSATDGDGGSARLPATGSNSGPKVIDMSDGSVVPSSGSPSTQFFYEVYYQDPNEDAPGEIYVYIDGTPSLLALETGLAYNGTYKSAGQLLDSDIHNYYFTATGGGEGGSVRLPVEGSFSGPSVNEPPLLSNGKVDPDSGKTSTDFYYYVDYYDKEGNIPEESCVYIDSVAYKMALYSGESSNGTYQYGPEVLEMGSHDFYFSFTDEDNNTFKLPIEGSFSGPTVNDPPQLSNGKVSPDSGSSSTDFYYYVDYYDKEGDTPQTAYLYVDNVSYVMSLYNGESSNGTYRYGPKLLKAGSHSFYFSFTDGYNDTVRLPAGDNYSGPKIASGSISIYDTVGDADIILDDSITGYATPSTISPVSIGMHKVTLLKSDYVSFPPYATVVVVEDQTVEIPFILLPCPAVTILKDDTGNLHLLRSFRDSVLKQTDCGVGYVNLYYTHALEISLLIMNDSELRIRVEKILYQLIPLLKPLMRKEKVFLLSEMKEEIELSLDTLEGKGSPFLKVAVRKIRTDLNKGKVLKDLEFEVDGENSLYRLSK